MSLLHIPKPVKLIIGIFLKDKSLFPSAVRMLADRYGSVDMVSRWFPFDLTDYYESEMGTPLLRRMTAFERLIGRENLAAIKVETNILEDRFALDGKRRVNLDPGYVAREHVVVATGKNFSHRIYIGQGVFADLTLLFHKGEFHKLPWTYPDYCRSDMLRYLKRVRDKYVRDLARAGAPPTEIGKAISHG
ncbi:MAG: DUF4416 domain-containing protein [Desulfobacterales bacterium CG07_land_8_20_14_0_80_52_14]|nr:MAG: GTP-binding protein [Desulfobacterales bacterium CG23_combo_of_CG06-09_8_20_14_all_52_9]PIU50483.1 MAG: DUF4416 domain-containing protein [Desulfobacterales bacterium CG07_land_8_20_14_0_80_52_14]